MTKYKLSKQEFQNIGMTKFDLFRNQFKNLTLVTKKKLSDLQLISGFYSMKPVLQNRFLVS